MSKELGKTIGHAGIYTIGIILNQSISFIMLPVYTRYLSPADYGVLELLVLTVDVVSIVAGLGIMNGMSKFYYQCDSEEEKKELISTLFMVVILFYFVACLFSSLSSNFISNIIFKTPRYSYFIFISFINMFLQIMFHVNLSYLRTQQKSISFVIASSFNLLFKLSLNILFVIHFEMGVLGILYSSLISFLIIGVWMSIQAFSKVGFHFSIKKARELVRFGSPFIVAGLGAFIMTYSDRFFLNHYGNLSSVGLYSLAYKFGFLIMMFPVQPMMNIWMVQRFEIVHQKGYEETFKLFLNWFSIITVSVALVTALAVRDVLRVMSAPAFWDAYKIVPIILLAYFLQACTDYFNFGVYYTGKTKHVAYGTLLSTVVIIGFSFLLIPKYGNYGAAWATLISFFIRLVYFYMASQKLFRINYDLARPLGTVILSIIVYLIYYLTTEMFPVFEKIYYSSFMIIGLIALFAYSLFIFNIIKNEEKKYIYYFMRSPVQAYSEFKSQLV